jgi:hypothetical protein
MATPNDSIDRALWRAEAKYERAIVAQYREALKGIDAELSALYRKYASGAGLTYAEMTKYNRLSKLEAEIGRVLGETDRKVKKSLERLAAEQYEEAYFRHAYTIERQAGASIAWGMLRKEDIIAAVANPLDLIARNTLTGLERSRVRRAVVQGLIRGESYQKMARGIKEALDRSVSDALRIARTEAHRAQMEGSVAAFDKAESKGADIRRIWVATKDDRTRDTHRELDETEAEMHDGETMWNVGGTWARFPGDPVLPPDQSVNCRCQIREEASGLEPESIRVNGEVMDYKKYMESTSYKEWREGKTR